MQRFQSIEGGARDASELRDRQELLDELNDLAATGESVFVEYGIGRGGMCARFKDEEGEQFELTKEQCVARLARLEALVADADIPREHAALFVKERDQVSRVVQGWPSRRL